MVYRFYCMALFHSQTRRHVINQAKKFHTITFLRCNIRMHLSQTCGLKRSRPSFCNPHNQFIIERGNESSGTCADPESFLVRKGQTLTATVFLWVFFYEERKGPNTTLSGPASAPERMAFLLALQRSSSDKAYIFPS